MSATQAVSTKEHRNCPASRGRGDRASLERELASLGSTLRADLRRQCGGLGRDLSRQRFDLEADLRALRGDMDDRIREAESHAEREVRELRATIERRIADAWSWLYLLAIWACMIAIAIIIARKS